MRKIRTTDSFYWTREEGGPRTRSHTGSSNARSDGARQFVTFFLGYNRNLVLGSKNFFDLALPALKHELQCLYA